MFHFYDFTFINECPISLRKVKTLPKMVQFTHF